MSSDRSVQPNLPGSRRNITRFQTGRRHSNTQSHGRTGGNGPSYVSAFDNLLMSMNSLNLRDSSSRSSMTSQPSRGTVYSSTISPLAPATTAPRRPHVVASEKEIDDYIQQVVNTVTPSPTELARKREICSLLQLVIRRIVPYAHLTIIGGVANNFALKDCDLDLCIESEIGDRIAREIDMELRKEGNGILPREILD